MGEIFSHQKRLYSDHCYYLVYAGYLWFQLYSHTSLYNDEGDNVAKSTIYSPRTHHLRDHLPHRKNKDVESPGTSTVATEAECKDTECKDTECKEAVELETPQMNVWTTIGLLVVITVVSYTSYFTRYLSFALTLSYSW